VYTVEGRQDLKVHQSRQDEGGRRITGEMVWFNNDKDFGFIATTTGERVHVAGSAFRNGSRPEGRCAGLQVTFRAIEGDEQRSAEDVAFVDEAPSRRARSRRSGHR
jgi:cold shock CspA family protein